MRPLTKKSNIKSFKTLIKVPLPPPPEKSNSRKPKDNDGTFSLLTLRFFKKNE